MARLEVSLGSFPLLALQLGETITRLGRTPDNDVVLPLPEVAEHHAEIDATGEVARIHALGDERLTFGAAAFARSNCLPAP